MDPSSLNWSKQLRREAPLSAKHTVSSAQKVYYSHQNIDHNMRRYQRPPKISELAKEIKYLKQEAMEKITLETESQKTFESIQKQMDLLRNCFESFTSMIVDECEDLRRDQLKAFEDINEAESKCQSEIQNTFQPICDNIAQNTAMKLQNLQMQINELKNLILLNNCSENDEKYSTPKPKSNESYSTNFESYHSTLQNATQIPEPRIDHRNGGQNDAISELTSTVAKQQQIIDELKRKLKHIDRTISNTEIRRSSYKTPTL